jgi:hypothetical protein
VRRNENAGMGINGRPAEALRRCSDGTVAVGRCLGGGIWILGSWEKREHGGGGRGCTVGGRKWGKGKKQ